MGFAGRVAGAAVTVSAAGTALALFNDSGTQAAGPPPSIRYLEAAPRAADEGDFVALVARADGPDSAPTAAGESDPLQRSLNLEVS